MKDRTPIPEFIVFEKKEESRDTNEYTIVIVPAHKCIIRGTGLVRYSLEKTNERYMEMSVEQIEQVEKRVDLVIEIDGKEHDVTRLTVVPTIFDALSTFREWSAKVMSERHISDHVD